MKAYNVPVLLIGIFLTIIGIEVLAAPTALIVTPAHAIAFEAFGRPPLGAALTLSGLATVLEGWKGSRMMLGLFAGILNAIFWFIVTLLPLKFGSVPTELFGFEVNGTINGVSVMAWLLISCLAAYFYSKRDHYWEVHQDRLLLKEIREVKSNIRR